MSAPQHPPPRLGGAWYYVVTVLSVGLLAVIPFGHAAARLKTPALWRAALLYGVADAVLLVLAGLGRDGDDPGVLGTVAGVLGLVVMVVACVQIGPLRGRVYGHPETRPPGTPTPDPAIAGVLAARARRVEARRIAETDPLMALDLRIGRPDLPRHYDDGGLVDLASAPTEVIVGHCGVTADTARRIVQARGAFQSVDELLVVVELPIAEWDRLRDRAVVVRA